MHSSYKQEQTLKDSLDTHIDGSLSGFTSFQSQCQSHSQSRSILNSSRTEKVDQSTITDQLICNCDPELIPKLIPKLKEKAHKSFMQVIQIQSLYKEEIQELKNFYEESLKNKDKKFKIKQELLSQKCKELQAQIQKIKQHYQRQRPHQISQVFQSPFELDNTHIILKTQLLDDSSQSIYNIRDFMQTPNLKQTSQRLQTETNMILRQLKRSLQNVNSDAEKVQDINGTLLTKLQQKMLKVFQFIRTLIESTVQAHQNYNDLMQMSSEAQNRYMKFYGLYQASQKQSKFMADHIKRISQDKIRMQKKANQLQRNSKALQDSIKLLKKVITQQSISLPSQNQKSRKQMDVFQSFNFIDEDDQDSSKNSMICSQEQRRSANQRTNLGSLGENKILPRGLNFKKKGQSVQQKDNP